MKLRKLGYYVRSSLALARRLRRRRDVFRVFLDPSRKLQFDDGLELRIRDRLDLLIVKEALCDDVYGLAHLVAPRFIVDVGAGIGSFAVLVGRRFPACRVLAFEPDPEQCALLRENAAVNGSLVESLCVAVGTRPGYLLSGRGAQSSTARPADARALPVSGRRLIEFIGDQTVDLLKIDCEGAELDVLRSVSHEGLERVSRVALEYHNFRGERNDTLSASLLTDAGFEVRRFPDPYDTAIGYLHASRP
jgi:FkbM family methyltransferase